MNSARTTSSIGHRYVPSYSPIEFNEILAQFKRRSPKHERLAEALLHNENGAIPGESSGKKHSQRTTAAKKKFLNKKALREATGLEAKEVETLLEEMRNAFADYE